MRVEVSTLALYIYSTCVTERAFTLVSNTTHKDIDDRGEPSPRRPLSHTHRVAKVKSRKAPTQTQPDPLRVRTKPLRGRPTWDDRFSQ